MVKALPKINKLEEYLTKLVYYCVFARDKDTCVVCGKHVRGRDRQPSHVIPKARSSYLRWDMENIKTLCYVHHLRWWHQHPLKAGKWFEEKYPERAKYLEEREHILLSDELRKQNKSYREWLNEQIEKYEQELHNLGGTLD